MGTPVKLFVYDLSEGVARMISNQLLGRQVEGIWHSSIVVFEREFCFGSNGIMSSAVGGTALGPPQQVIELGETYVPYLVFREYLQGLKETNFSPSSYDLFRRNCNHFSDEVAQFLCGTKIPSHIVELPDIILDSDIGPVILQLVDGLSRGASVTVRPGIREYSPEFEQLNLAIEEVRRSSIALKESRKELSEKLAKKEKKRKKKLKKEEKERQRIREIEKELERNGYKFRPLPQDQFNLMAEGGESLATGEENGLELDAQSTSEAIKKARDLAAEIEAEELKELQELRRAQKYPPVVYRELLDVKVEFGILASLLEGKLSPEEKNSLEELRLYMLENEGSWALGDDFFNFIERLLSDKTLSDDVRTRLLNVLACAAIKEDIILLLHQDRKDHVLMNYAAGFERLSPGEQEGLSLLFANLFDNLGSSEWLLYISEWEFRNGTLSNIRATTKVAVNAVLSENPKLQDYGSAIIYNMACKEVFDDVAIELTMALLQFLNHKPNEELLFRSLKSLSRLCIISGQDVWQMIQMIGLDASKFKGVSERIDEQLEHLGQRFD